MFLTHYGKWASYPDLSDGQAELLDVTIDAEPALKWEAIGLHFDLFDQFF